MFTFTGTHREHGSSLVSVERKTLAKWMKRAPMACLDVSKNLGKKQKFSFIFHKMLKVRKSSLLIQVHAYKVSY